MIICALDPGTRATACVIYDTALAAPIVYKDKLQNDSIRGFIQRAAREHNAEVFAIERMQSYGMPVGSEVFDTCVWIGRFIQVAIERHFRIWPVYRKPIVAWLTGKAKGNDATVRKALIERFGEAEVGRVGSDIRSAIAVALYVEHLIKGGGQPPSVLGGPC